MSNKISTGNNNINSKTPREFNKRYNPNLYTPRDEAKTNRNLLIFIGIMILGIIIQYIINGYTFSTKHSLMNEISNFYKIIYLFIIGL